MMITSYCSMAPPLTRSPSSGDLLRHLGENDPTRSLDQREVREGLRKVAEVSARLDVELLRVQPERGLDQEQLLHEVARPLHLADDRERGAEPERADEERP